MPPLWQRVTSRILATRTSSARREEFIGDLAEDYAHYRRTRGRIAASWWLVREIRSLQRAYSHARDRRAGALAESIVQDIRYAVRSYARTPLLTLAALMTLTLGIGATSAMFGVVDAVVLRPLPYRDADQLVRVYQVRRSAEATSSLSPPNFFDLRDQMGATAALAAFWSPIVTTTDSAGHPQRLLAAINSHDLFAVLDVAPLRGRSFLPTDDVPGAPRVVVIGHGLWQRMFNGDEAVLGRQFMIDGSPAEIIGVMPQGFDFPAIGTEVWMPLRLSRTQPPNPAIPPADYRGYRILSVVGRRAQGVSFAHTNTQLARIAENLERQYPSANRDVTARAVPLHDDDVAAVRPALLVLFGAVGCVLLIACANVSGLLLVRSIGRTREVSVRRALGASRLRIARQALTESLVLCITGGLAGLAAGRWGFRALLRLAPPDTPHVDDVATDAATILFTIGITLAVGLVCGLAPALRREGGRLDEALRASRGAIAGSGRRLRQTLVVAQIALSLMLLIGAGLLIQSFVRIARVEIGFQTKNVVAVDRIDLPRTAAAPAASAAFFERLLTVVREIPGISSAGLTLGLPLDPKAHFFVDPTTFSIEGQPARLPADRPSAPLHVVSADYFVTMGVPLERGRWFDARDRGNAPGVILINEAMALQFWPNDDPIGRHITHDLAIVPGQAATREIVGVVGNVRHFGLGAQAEPQMFIPHAQMPWPSMAIVVRTTMPADQAGAAVRQAVWTLDKSIPVPAAMHLGHLIEDALGQPKFRAWMLGAFAGSALLLAMIGLYGLMAYGVQLRTREIGLRLALGSTPRQATALLLRGGLRLTIVGVALGLAGATVGTRLLSTFLFGVGAVDPATFVALPLLLVSLASAACYLPARRVRTLDPATSLNRDR